MRSVAPPDCGTVMIHNQTMKRLRSIPPTRAARKVACTVSAASLMLGVSQAATVGFHFQTDYCSSNTNTLAAYSGAVVTATAFGIGPAGWENLLQMDTGYNTCVGTNFTLNEIINTNSSAIGLNPLPSGSLNLTWSAIAANVSGFGGYSRSGPHYTFGGPGYQPGNEQVYWGFLRDGVNWGPGESGGDNDQPGYSIDITGLKSVFTNGPFAVQLMASSDSMQFLTNAFIIDAAANSTQSVVYPSTPPVSNVGDTPWIRGIGGGLSTASGAVNTDHLIIAGNRAAHTPSPGLNWASTITGFILTDKPVVSMPPNSVQVFPGDTVALSAYAVGVPPMAYQWRKNGQPIAGATTLAYTNLHTSASDSYDLVVTNLYGAATSAVAVVSVDFIKVTPGSNFVVDSSPNAPPHDGTAIDTTWLASSTDSMMVARSGVVQFSNTTNSQIVVSGQTNFDTTAGTVMFWIRTPSLPAASTNPAVLFNRGSSDGLAILQNTDGTVQVETISAPTLALVGPNLSDNLWHHVAVTYDQNAGTMSLYVDGTNALTSSMTPWNWVPGTPIEFGLASTQPGPTYGGLLDDVRIYQTALSAADITSAYHNTLPSPSSLLLEFNFDTAPSNGITLRWLCPDAILQSADSVAGPYSDLPGAVSPYAAAASKTMKFYRYRGHTPESWITNPYLM
jgi:Concanavalin A-like lectin/glucanases superfamily/Immunoglobulin domain